METEKSESNIQFRTLLKKQELAQNQLDLTTGCKKIDAFLDGGISFGKVTEIAGVAGSGKSQIAMQIALNTLTAYPGYKIVYITVLKQLSIERLMQLKGFLTRICLRPALEDNRARVLRNVYDSPCFRASKSAGVSGDPTQAEGDDLGKVA